MAGRQAVPPAEKRLSGHCNARLCRDTPRSDPVGRFWPRDKRLEHFKELSLLQQHFDAGDHLRRLHRSYCASHQFFLRPRV